MAGFWMKTSWRKPSSRPHGGLGGVSASDLAWSLRCAPNSGDAWCCSLGVALWGRFPASPGFPGTSGSSGRRAAAHKVHGRNQI